MKIHILGICGSFMSGIALLAKASNHTVSGSDANVYPPMSTQLQAHGIKLLDGYYPAHLQPVPDLVIVGNVMSRGDPMIETILNNKIPYISGPQWLSEQILRTAHVLAVSGTHGKTTIASMLAWILECAGLGTGFLIGGVPQNFGISARLGSTNYFVIEADEYDTAFFDKRSKFIHYHPDTLIINNIEYDHADIFNNIDDILRQFHHVVRIVPENGVIICRHDDRYIGQVLKMGCWTPIEYFNCIQPEEGKWSVQALNHDCSQFDVFKGVQVVGKVNWKLFGQFNAENALTAIIAATYVGVSVSKACEALNIFKNAKRRLELLACVNRVYVYDDFAHHPTAIRATLQALRQKVKDQRIIAIIEPRSNTMRQVIHKASFAQAFSSADSVYLYIADDINWNVSQAVSSLAQKVNIMCSINDIIDAVSNSANVGDHIVIMSNGSFANLHKELIKKLSSA